MLLSPLSSLSNLATLSNRYTPSIGLHSFYPSPEQVFAKAIDYDDRYKLSGEGRHILQKSLYSYEALNYTASSTSTHPHQSDSLSAGLWNGHSSDA